MTNEDPATGFGISWLWAFEKTVFDEAAYRHDAAYTAGSEEQRTMSRLAVDRRLLADMLSVSTTMKHKAAAYGAYAIVRAFGWYWWEG